MASRQERGGLGTLLIEPVTPDFRQIAPSLKFFKYPAILNQSPIEFTGSHLLVKVDTPHRTSAKGPQKFWEDSAAYIGIFPPAMKL